MSWYKSLTWYCKASEKWETILGDPEPTFPDFKYNHLDVARHLAKNKLQHLCVKCQEPVNFGINGLTMPCCCCSFHLDCLPTDTTNKKGYFCPVCGSYVEKTNDKFVHTMNEDYSPEGSDFTRWEMIHKFSPKTYVTAVDDKHRGVTICRTLTKPADKSDRF
jgi:hypothetical protein